MKNSNQYVLDPRQENFLEAYYDPSSFSFSNAYQSAIKSGYSKTTAKNILNNSPKWLSEFSGKSNKYEPSQLLEKLADIINHEDVKISDKLKAIELLMKHHRMLTDRVQVNKTQLSIEALLDTLM
jgi:hypothetical protein